MHHATSSICNLQRGSNKHNGNEIHRNNFGFKTLKDEKDQATIQYCEMQGWNHCYPTVNFIMYCSAQRFPPLSPKMLNLHLLLPCRVFFNTDQQCSWIIVLTVLRLWVCYMTRICLLLQSVMHVADFWAREVCYERDRVSYASPYHWVVYVCYHMVSAYSHSEVKWVLLVAFYLISMKLN